METPTLVQASPSAAAAATRMKQHPFSSQLKSQWNNEIAALVFGVQNFYNEKALNWGRGLLYGPTKEKETTTTTQASSS